MVMIYVYLLILFLFLLETGSPYVAHTGLKLLGSSSPPASASQSAEITGVSHHVQPRLAILESPLAAGQRRDMRKLSLPLWER